MKCVILIVAVLTNLACAVPVSAGDLCSTTLTKLKTKNEIISTGATKMSDYSKDMPRILQAGAGERHAIWNEVALVFDAMKSARQDILEVRGICIPEELADKTIATLDRQITTIIPHVDLLKRMLTN